MNQDPASEFFEIFIEECRDHFEALDQELVSLEKEPTRKDLLFSVMRRAHTLKGSAGMFGLDGVRELAHRLEDLMDLAHDDPAIMTREAMDVLFEGFDLLRGMLKRAEGGQGADLTPREGSFLERFGAFLKRLERGGGSLEDGARALLLALEDRRDLIEGRDGEALRQAVEVVRSHLGAEAGPQRKAGKKMFLGAAEVGGVFHGLDAFLAGARSRAPGREDVESFFSLLEELLEAAGGSGVQALEASCVEAREAMALFRSLHLDFDEMQNAFYRGLLDSVLPHLREEEKARPAAGVPPAAEAGESKAQRRVAETARKTIRIDEDKIDAFLDSVGEMIILGEVFHHLQKRVEGEKGAGAELLREFKAANLSFGSHIFSLQNSLMNVRRVEIRNVTGSLARLVRDTCRDLGKDIDFRVEGEESVVDKSLLDDVNTCLVHLVRNAIDHGIEATQGRRERGKPEKGSISIAAANDENSLLLEVRDDGGGVDLARVREKVLEKGLRPREELAAMKDDDLLRLVFLDGVSTAQKVTEVSGRGVGMAVVLDKIQRFGGLVDIRSEPGKGTAIQLRIPLSVMLKVMDGLVVRVSGSQFVLPLRNVVETFRPGPGGVFTVQGRGEGLMLRGELSQVIRLADHLGLPRQEGVGVAVLVAEGGRKACLLVDAIVDHQQVVMKVINGMERLRSFTGGALLGDGSIGFIVNVEHVLRAR